jgi:hypothetical protein
LALIEPFVRVAAVVGGPVLQWFFCVLGVLDG